MTADVETITLQELGPVVGYDEFPGAALISNLSDSVAQFDAELHRRGVPGVAATASLDIPTGDTLGYDDVVGDLFSVTDVGTVVLRTVNGTRIAATGREYALVRNGQGTVFGTAGQLIRGLTDAELLEPGTTYHLLGVRHRETSEGLERAHAAAFNPGHSDVEVKVRLHDGLSGTCEGSRGCTVRGGELVRANAIIEDINPDQDGTAKRLQAVTDGPVFIGAFRVNSHGDPVTTDAVR